MTKKLAETFGFTDDEEIDDSTEITEYDNSVIDIQSEMVEISSPEQQLIDDSGISDHELEMNQIFAMAIDAHKKTMDLGFGVEPKNSSPGLSSSTSFLNIALNASKSKVEKKLSLVRIKLENNSDKNKKNNSTIEKNDEVSPDQIAGDAMDRNDLMEELKAMIEKK